MGSYLKHGNRVTAHVMKLAASDDGGFKVFEGYVAGQLESESTVTNNTVRLHQTGR